MDVATAGQSCAGCGALFSQTALACPSCQKLVHTEALQKHAQDARDAERAGDVAAQLSAWQAALQLLPEHSRQHGVVLGKVRELAALTEKAPGAPHKSEAWKKGLGGGLTALALILWKFKAVGIFLVGKLKFLLLGLTKAKTLLSMLLSMGLYFTLWGWKFAVGFVLSIYVHEMGHVAAMRKQGIPVSAPMFIPGVGAFVRGANYPTTPADNARIGLAGPVWGLGAATLCAAIYFATDVPIWGALAKSGAFVNLFNLLPIFGLDGAHGFQALGKRDRIIVFATFLGAWMFTQEGLLILIALVAGYRAFATPPAEQSDARTLFEFVGLIVALTFLMHMHLPV